MPSTPRSTVWTSISPEPREAGRSTWVMSPVITIFELNPRRVRNIFICSVVLCCASSRMMNASLRVRPRMYASGAIEIAPLAYMRGRTLKDAFIILDEAQHSTTEQMKMFLTRLGFNSKMVITGDITQVDLPASRGSGLIEVQTVLRGVEGIEFVYFDEGDVVRHRLVSAIVRAYDVHGARTRDNGNAADGT